MSEILQDARSSKRSLMPVAVFLFAVLLSFVFFAIVKRWESALLFTNFQWRASVHAAAIQRQLDLVLDGVDTMGGFMAIANVEQTGGLEALADTIFRSHGAIVAFAWAPILPSEAIANSTGEAPKEQLFSRECGGIQGKPAPLIFLYPQPPRPGLELDLHGDATLAPTVMAAAKERAIQISPSFSWPAEGPRHVIIVRPVFRDVGKGKNRTSTLCGYAVGVLAPGALVERALAPLPVAGIDIGLYDATPSGSEQRLYFHASRGAAGISPQTQEAPRKDLTIGEWLDVPGRRWKLRLDATPFFFHKLVLWRANAVLVAGLLLSALLGSYFVVRHRYEREFRRINRTLQTEVEERKRAEAAIRYQASHDPLTDLANRALFYELADVALTHAARAHQNVAFLFVDIDGFKRVNDRFGHDAGDRLLREIGERLRASTRQADVIARVGGDEFVALLVDIRDAEAAATVASAILTEIACPFRINERDEVAISASIGIALCPQDGTEKEMLLRQADAAMYAAKQAGKNRYRFWSA